MSEMMDLGFTDVKEVFNNADADIIARLEYNNEHEPNQKIIKLVNRTNEKITQISYNG